MTIEKLKNAQRLQERIQRVEEILQILEEVRNNEVQKKDVVEEDFITNAALHNNEEKAPKWYYYLTRTEIEIIKKAFENYKGELNSEFSFL
jgi:hypothetical protein